MSADFRAFRSKAEAREHMATMQGWDTGIDLVFWPDHPLATRRGNIIIIHADEIGTHGKRGHECTYLRDDGYVR